MINILSELKLFNAIFKFTAVTVLVGCRKLMAQLDQSSRINLKYLISGTVVFMIQFRLLVVDLGWRSNSWLSKTIALLTFVQKKRNEEGKEWGWGFVEGEGWWLEGEGGLIAAAMWKCKKKSNVGLVG